MKRKIIYVVIVVFVITVLMALWYTFRSSPDTVKKTRAEYTLTAEQIVNDYENDEDASNNKYLDKVIIVEGTIAEITINNNDRTTVNIEGSFTGNASCMLGEFEQLDEKYTVGQKIKIKGQCTGFIMDVVFNKCVVIE